MELVGSEEDAGHLRNGYLDLAGCRPLSSSERTRNPAVEVVVPIRMTMTARLARGFPRQFMAIWENKRCIIRIHLLVPGGKRPTVSVNPVRSANCCSSHFQSRTLAPLLPPKSAVMSSEVAWG